MKQYMRDYHDILLLMFKITHGFILVCNESFFPPSFLTSGKLMEQLYYIFQI